MCVPGEDAGKQCNYCPLVVHAQSSEAAETKNLLEGDFWTEKWGEMEEVIFERDESVNDKKKGLI